MKRYKLGGMVLALGLRQILVLTMGETLAFTVTIQNAVHIFFNQLK